MIDRPHKWIVESTAGTYASDDWVKSTSETHILKDFGCWVTIDIDGNGVGRWFTVSRKAAALDKIRAQPFFYGPQGHKGAK